MGFTDMFKKKNKQVKTTDNYKMITDNGSGFFSWNGNLYQSDIIRSAIRPKAQAIGKSTPKHIQKQKDGERENPHIHMKFLLEEPNPYMTGQVFQEKLATQLDLNNNAFAYINRDENGVPIELYPIVPMSVQQLLDDNGELYLRFMKQDGQNVVFRYTDIIHLRKDFNSSELFGEPNGQALTNLMEVINTTDQGVVQAVKNSNIIRWLLKFKTTMRPEDIKENTDQFIEDFMDVDNENGSVGAAGIDDKMDAQQVDPKNYVPDQSQVNVFIDRIYAFFNTNEDIVKGQYTEDQWVSYFEANVQPFIKQMSNEFTRKLFTRRQRANGHQIIFESDSLTFASMGTKVDMMYLLDRSAITFNEFREMLNMAPVEGGDKYLRRLDSISVDEENDDTEPRRGRSDDKDRNKRR